MVVRFFNTTMLKETQIRYTMEPAEAVEVYMRMIKVSRSQVAVKDKLQPHKFSKDGKDTMTNLTIEKWVRGEKSGYALACQRGEVSHNVSLREGGFLYAAEVFKALSVSCNWQDAKPTRDDAVSALTTIKNHLNSKPQAVGLLRQLHAMITGPAPARR
ncbi:hypothetical protein [Geomonas agri]|uniref:hypothetical protein n=1 Tax=Geomonas agri TaxID=2873702 RepID=UPI001CD38E6E|nr:hypothetical protein [Geomonas agri]